MESVQLMREEVMKAQEKHRRLKRSEMLRDEPYN